MASTKRSDFRSFHRIQVRWAEVDMQKIVFNAHYLMYFDTAMSGYWRKLALPYEATLHGLGGDLFVKKASVEYHGSARYDDTIDVGLRCARIGTSSVVFEGAIFRGDTLLITAELLYVYANPATQTSQPVPEALRAVFDTFEEGQAVTDLQVGAWDSLREPVSSLRTDVFVNEQGIGAHMVWDAADATAVHALVCNKLGRPVATGRLLQHAPQVGRIGRMAVDRGLRGSRFGRDVLVGLLNAARARGDTEVMLHAQCSAEGFYTRQGFLARGPVFEEAGIQHIEMVLPLV
ncbi:YbgC/FadM family acyl-CoA thioesterase [Rhodoferax sp. AJA081-3]|uniref:YbgC/FadM family acyl-CoA thioesterase n=1 Tax=Rhodoferax sp. AJA081-3 TaxID=2752316 RepID=UPI001AE059AE|nr:YbgC/FadM family acyl-CoA thioesterase [Rhodoferax sp. AJA081-3]QTN28701.1 YbgC/FadM family acyl-CoA thioesterase [Rhodoferax sp. AJA081-3]